ncbi:hypothetical protein OCU04_008041 [Sclerotinia nivalis]|uniref:EKC/KEOPS complex subunit BUD32 n=1 Tax=Sclerotinia nivalis TaxID=352851 RepID=A0A9X0AI73_9HELO|nr:hypothetical protein OCU04_008041 [Sclerotinia nivalis]
MIPPEDRFWTESQSCDAGEDPGAKSLCNVWDWDQLRMIKLKGTLKVLPPDENKGNLILAQFADYLSPEVRAVQLDDDGLICGVSQDSEEDERILVPYPPFSTVKSLAGCRTIKHSQLQELDRLAPFVDLSSYEDENQNTRTVAFKFNVLSKPLRLEMAWNEINLLKSLPPHPNLVPFDGVVLEDVESRVIGLTTKYIPGGSLGDSKIPFRFEWLQQLTQVVDFLNLNLGIMHQDIAPRNLLIDPDTHKLLLFDFDYAACGMKRLMEGRDDVFGVVYTLYELITNDSHFAKVPHWERCIDMVQNIPEWNSNRELDADVSVFREYLNDWVKKRQSGGIMEQYLNAPNRPTWPDAAPTSHDYDVPFEHGISWDGVTNWMTGPRLVRTAKKLGQYCFEWQRPPQSRLTKKACVEIVNGNDKKLCNEDSQGTPAVAAIEVDNSIVYHHEKLENGN